jgi:hypothetical protein
MTFNSLYDLLNEAQFFNKRRYSQQLKGDDGTLYNVGRDQAIQKPVENSKIENIKDLKYRLDSLFKKYGFELTNLKDLDQKLADEDSTMLFRGHKTLNPFTKDIDTKSPRDTVYWAKQPNNALAFAKSTNTGGTRGRAFSNLVNSAYGNNAGYLSTAYPKYPQALVWYNDFGVEREEEDAEKYRKTYNKGLDYSKHSGTIEFPSYRMDRKNVEGKQKQFQRGETVLSPNEVTKLKTFIWASDLFSGSNNISLLNVLKIKEADPELYRILLWNRFE